MINQPNKERKRRKTNKVLIKCKNNSSLKRIINNKKIKYADFSDSAY